MTQIASPLSRRLAPAALALAAAVCATAAPAAEPPPQPIRDDRRRTAESTEPIRSDGPVHRLLEGVADVGAGDHDRAREAHKAAGTPEDDPVTDAAVANIYRESAKMLEQAVKSKDAGSFKNDFGRAWLKYGLSSFYAGDFEQAAEVFDGPASRLGTGEAAGQALAASGTGVKP